ncbi:MAG: hypothetical protein MUC93_01745 [Bacteroidales bacterium]|jgi:hypothetical protein|nr:hypothetical protein [Bacteroidales bacterium]
MEREKIKNIYQDLIDENEVLVGTLKRRLFIISIFRLIVFVAGLISAVRAFSDSVTLGIIILFLSVAFFLMLVKYYILLSEKIQFVNNLISINTSELKAFDGDYSAYNGGSEWKDQEHDFSNDTDLFGEDSLFRYLNRTVTGYGREILAGWLSDPYLLRNFITARQEAVKELAAKIRWRQEFMAHGLGKPLEKEDIESLRKWLAEKEKIFSSSLMKLIVLTSPVITIIILILASVKLIPFNFFGLLFILNLSVVGVYLKRSNQIHSRVSGKYLFLSSFEKLISSFGNEQFRSQILTGASGKLFSGNISASMKIRELKQILQAYDSRLNMFVGLILNGLVLWDFQCIVRLEKWKHETAGLLPLWLEIIGEVDSLISLSNHACNNPGYVFPEISDGEPVIDAINLGHPLIDEKSRVCNDFLIGHKGLICIITGANMAGKSTYLRTIAVNMILGMAGTTVCADKFNFTPCFLFTSMRTTDSLSNNESYFYAELKRLKILKERLESGVELFFILDEILKGTNSTDKSTGSKLFLGKLAAHNGTGLIATHDISLGDMEKEFPGKIFNKCFEVEIDGENISFDYKLRDGITQHMNAGILMRQMGII